MNKLSRGQQLKILGQNRLIYVCGLVDYIDNNLL